MKPVALLVQPNEALQLQCPTTAEIMATEAEIQLLKKMVLEDMAQYLAEHNVPREGNTIGALWDLERVARELDNMRILLVDPYETEYNCDDALVAADLRLPQGKRRAYVVAEDVCYRLLFDDDAGDFVLVEQSANGTWFSWGIRGDASTSFLAR